MAVLKLINNIPNIKRDGSQMTQAAIKTLLFDKNRSNDATYNVMIQSDYLSKILKELDNSPSLVIQKLKDIRLCCNYAFM